MISYVYETVACALSLPVATYKARGNKTKGWTCMTGKKPKHLLGIRDLTTEDILAYLHYGKIEKEKVLARHLRDDSLKHASISTLFYENSTRTKMSFLLAAKYLGAHADDLNISTSSVQKGESLIDTGLTLDAMGTNAIVIRHGMVGAAHILAQNVNCSIINGGDGSNEHPTQALLDALTILEHKGDFKGLQVTIVGDVATSRVARSNIFLLTKMGAKVTVAGPATLLNSHMAALGVKVTTQVAQAVKDADVVMALRVQLERHKAGQFPSLGEYHQFFGVDMHVLSHAKPDAIVMHPAPVNRGVEISSQVMDAPQSVIYPQVTHGVAMRMAILKVLLG